jgi:hypothetical protein
MAAAATKGAAHKAASDKPTSSNAAKCTAAPD